MMYFLLLYSYVLYLNMHCKSLKLQIIGFKRYFKLPAATQQSISFKFYHITQLSFPLIKLVQKVDILDCNKSTIDFKILDCLHLLSLYLMYVRVQFIKGVPYNICSLLFIIFQFKQKNKKKIEKPADYVLLSCCATCLPLLFLENVYNLLTAIYLPPCDVT